MSGARDLVLRLLEQGYQPQHLNLNTSSDSSLWLEACQREFEAIKAAGRADLIDWFERQLQSMGLEIAKQIDDDTSIWQQHAGASAELTADLQQQLEQAIQLREHGEAEASLLLLEHLAEQGVRSPWLADNQARVLVNLQRRAEAMEIWDALGQSADVAVAEQAQAMEQQLRQASIQQLLEHARRIAAGAGQPISRLEGVDAQTLEDLEHPLLEVAIQLRNGGHPQASLELLVAAEHAGLSSGWLTDNQARALVDLGRRGEAIALWNALVDHPEEGLRSMASELLELQTTAQLQDLRDNLARICLEQGWVAQELQDPADNLEALEQAVLKESIRSRDAGQAATSLLLIEAAQAGGMSSPWLKDNQARALVNLQRLPEAVELWRDLEALADQEALAAMAREMLEQYAAEADRLAATNKAMELAEKGQMEQAKTLLVRAMVVDPGWEGYTTALKQVLKQEKGSQDNADLLERELTDDRLNLEAFDVYLDLVEERLKAAAASGST